MMSPHTHVTHNVSPVQMFRFRKKLKLLERIPFDQKVLRTGDCLARLQMNSGSNAKTYHLSFAAYDRLQGLPPVSTDKKKVRVPNDLLFVQDAFADFQQRCRPDVLSDREWVCPSAEPFVRSEWVIIPLHGMPMVSQPLPAPLAGADEYGVLHFRERIPFADIPNLNKKTQAKKLSNLFKKKTEKDRLCAERHALYMLWAKVLRKDYNSEPHEKPIHDPRCTRCGGEFFKKNLDCYDCGWNMSHFVHERESIDEEIAHDPRSENNGQINQDLTEYNLTKGRARAGIRQEEFLIALLLNSRSAVTDLCMEGGRDKARSALRVLVNGEFPKKVASETGESQRAN